MGGFVQFSDGNWSWNTSLTRIMFDLLEARSTDPVRKQEMRELRDDNVLMLDLRSPSEDPLVKIIVDDLNDYLVTRFGPGDQKKFERGFSELLRLARAQHIHNQHIREQDSPRNGD
jgi:hypothetical protein